MSAKNTTLAGLLLGVAAGGLLLAGLAWTLRDTGPVTRAQARAEQERLAALGRCYLEAEPSVRPACETRLLAVSGDPTRLALSVLGVPLAVLVLLLALAAPVAGAGLYLLAGHRRLGTAMALFLLAAVSSTTLAGLGVLWEYTAALAAGQATAALGLAASLLPAARVLEKEKIRSVPVSRRAVAAR